MASILKIALSTVFIQPLSAPILLRWPLLVVAGIFDIAGPIPNKTGHLCHLIMSWSENTQIEAHEGWLFRRLNNIS